MNEPIRHHYIPQFILRNFCFDSTGQVHYYNKITGEVTDQDNRNVFMARNLYRDEINSPQCPTQLERDFSVFEREVSEIIKGKFLSDDFITLTMEEDAKLRLFFAMMGFRSERTRSFYENGLSHPSKKFFEKYQPNRNFVDLWKRNLKHIVNCRSIQEVINHTEIDDPIKAFFYRDTLGIFGMYFVVVERRDSEEFIIGDDYPLVVAGTLPNGVEMHMYSVFPISPNRAILMVSNGTEGTPRECMDFRPCVIALPKINEDGTCTIKVKKVYSEEVKPINEMILKEAQCGVVFKSSGMTLNK